MAAAAEVVVPETPDAPPKGDASPLATEVKSLLGRYEERRKALEELLPGREAAYERAGTAAEAATKRAAAVGETVLRPAVEGVRRAAEVPQPPVPGALPEPAQPSQQLRPFLDVKTARGSFDALLSSLSLIGQMVAARGAPVAALSAIDGALRGWHQGDKERAEREWKSYLHQVDTIRHENTRALELWKAAMEQSRGRLDQAQAIYTASSGEAGLADRAATAAREGMTAAGQQLDRVHAELDKIDSHTGTLINQMMTHELRVAIEKSTAQYRAESLKERAAHNRALEKISQQNSDIRKALTDLKASEHQAGYAVMGGVLTDMKGLVKALDDKGALPKDSSPAEAVRAWGWRQLHPNDDDWRQWMALQGAMVGYERQVYQDKGARALQVYKSLLDFVAHPPTAKAGVDIIERMEKFLVASQRGPGTAPEGETLPPGAHREGADIVSDSGKYVWKDGAWQPKAK